MAAHNQKLTGQNLKFANGGIVALLLSFLLLGYFSSSAQAQTPDTLKAVLETDSLARDSTQKLTFKSKSQEATLFGPSTSRFQRVLQAEIGPGAGFYNVNSVWSFQPTANLEFLASTSIIDLVLGVHVGFSHTVTTGLNLGARFGSAGYYDHGSYFDAGLLFFDNNDKTNGFQTGVRLAGGYRFPASVDVKAAAELRGWPSAGTPVSTWAGIEVGYFFNLIHEPVRALSRKDSLRAALRYIAEPDEMDQLESVQTDAELDRWLNGFWTRRKLDVHASQNAVEEEYIRRVEYVNKEYSHARRLGVETDRGRIYLLYGNPDRIEAGNSLSGTDVSYLLWIYDGRIRGTSEGLFLFETANSVAHRAFVRADAEPTLVYSNVFGEYTSGIPTDVPINIAHWLSIYGR